MNKNLYRVIFSHAANALIAVAETTAAHGKRNHRCRTKVATTPQKRLTTLGVILAALFGHTSLAHAQMVAYKNGAGPKPVIDQSANGRTVVQIVNPNASGLSHNKYDQFSVDGNGAILNNSLTDVATQQAGYIQGNQQLSRAANVILNEVMSVNRSQLNGYIEVAGQRADVIVANPNGISVGNGAGFINASRAVLTTGTPVLNGDGSLAAFRVTRGDITIGSGGMNANQTNQLDVIARSIQVNDQVWANNLNVVAGANQIDYRSMGVTMIQGEGGQPTVGIDSSALGGMYAQKIMFIGTEKGVGVNLSGNVLALSGDFRLDNAGKITLNGTTNATGQITLNANDDVINNGTIYGKSSLTINSAGQIKNLGSIAADQNALLNSAGQLTNTGSLVAVQNLNLNAGSIDSTGLLSAGVDSNGQLTPGNLTLNASGKIVSSGQHSAGGDLTITGADIDLAQAQSNVGGNVNLNATAGNINHSGATLVANNATLNATGALINDRGVIKASQLIAQSNRLSNIGGSFIQSGAGYTRITTRLLNNADGIIGSDNDLTIHAGSLIGNGQIITGRDANITLNSDYTFTDQTVFKTNRHFAFTSSGTLTNTTQLNAVGNLTLNADKILNVYGALINAGNGLTLLNASDSIYNLGRIYGNDIAINTAQLTNDGVVDGQGNIVQAGVIASRNDLDIGADTITNRNHALMQSLGDLRIGSDLDNDHHATGQASYLLNASASIDAGGDMVLGTARLDNVNLYFKTTTQQEAAHYVKYYMLNGSDIKYYDGVDAVVRNEDSFDKLVLNDGSRHNDYTIFYVLETVERTVVDHSDPGKITAGGNIVLSGQVNNDKSQIVAGGAITGDLSGLVNTDAKGEVRITRGGDGEDCHKDIFGDTICIPRSYSMYHTIGSDWGGSYDDYGDKVAFYEIETTHPNLNIVAFLDNQQPDHPNNDAIGKDVDESEIPSHPGIPRVIPNSQLFPITTDPNANYLIETDPHFTNYQTFLSSDYMLSRLGIDPEREQKRLGDGFFEQQLVNNQILQLTGKRFVGDYTNNQEQYQALMNNGLQYAQAFHLTPGIALSADQMAALTTDMVWLVSQDVTLPDGSKQNVMVPVVYLAKADSAQLQPTGALVSGRQLALNVSGNVQNDGALQATNSAVLQAANITNTGVIQSDAIQGHTQLTASNDIINTGGQINGHQVDVSADRDVVMSTTVSSNQTRTGNATHGFSSDNTIIDQVASVNADQLTIQSGRDMRLTATQINTTGNATLAAGRDINLDTVTTKESFAANYDAKNNLSASQTHVVGAQITNGGNLTMLAGQDINAQAAYANAQGAIVATAGHDINLGSAQQDHRYAQETYTTSGGLLSSKSVHTQDQQQSTQSVGTTLSGNTVGIAAGHDVTLAGSNAVSTLGTSLVAGNNVTLTTTENTSSSAYNREEKQSGLMAASGGIGVTLGTRDQQNAQTTQSLTHNASTVGSTDGNVTIQAGNAYAQTGSHVLAIKGDTTVVAKSIDITHVTDIQSGTEDTKFKETGLTLAVSAPIISAAETISQMASATQNTDDARMQVMGAAVAADAVYRGYEAAQNLTKDVTISLTLGTSQSESHSDYTAKSVQGSTISAGGNVNLIATGGGVEGSHINITGSNVTAGNNAALISDGQINLEAAQNTNTQHSSSSSSGAAVGVVASSASGLGVTANGSISRGRGNGDDIGYTNTNVSAGKTMLIASGSDTNLKGAAVIGKQVVTDIQGNLNMESPQDASNYHSKDQNAGGSLTVGIAPGAGFTASVNVGQTKVNGDYQSVTQQTGIFAGDGGFQVNVKGNTDLKGAVIASSQAAIDNNKNSFTTGSLTQSNLQNHSNYDASGFAVGMTVGKEADKPSTAQSDATQVANHTAGLSGTSAGFSSESGNSASTTKSGISGNANGSGITITNETQQQLLTGQTAAQAVASINKDITSDTASNGLSKDWNAQQLKNQVNAEVQITAAFGQMAAQRIGNYADKQALKLQATDPEEAAKWAEGGEYRVALHTAAGALAGGVGGAVGAFTSAESMTVISDTINKMGLPKEVAQGLNQVTAATLGALVGGAAGAASGLNVEANNRQLHPDETKWIQDNASRYAEQKGISEAQAITRLAQQAYRQVQAGAGGAWDADASTFLGQAHGMLAADPNCPTCGPGYMFYATPDQKANPNMYAEQLAQTSEFYAKNGLTLPTSQQIADAVKKGAEIRSNLNTATKAALAVSAGAALSGLSPTLLQWALSNPVAATEAGIITAETAAAIVSGAVTPSGLLRQMSNPQAARVIYDRLATAATKNTESSEVVLGRYLAGNANSYEQVAQARGATYYEVGAWDSMFKELGKEKMWEVNKGFLDKAIVEGKTFVFTNDPETVLKTAPTSFSADEVKHLMNNGYKFVQEGEVWRGIKK